ncbi:MAG: nicotinate phosphoribosyltransferase [Candidatus Pacearchaeota archaeon]
MRKAKDKPILNLPTFNDIPCLEYGQIFTGSSIWHETGEGDKIATFDVVIREMPGNRNFMLFSGIEDVIKGLLNWKYDKKYLKLLVSKKIITKKFETYLKNFKFKGDVWALPEGTVFFPGEPVIRITASLKDANLLTSFLINSICFPTLYFTKAVRVKLASNGKLFEVSGAVRAGGFENILKIYRIGYLLDSANSVPYIPLKYHLPEEFGSIVFYHALIKSFSDERAAFEAFANYKNEKLIKLIMVDTYDIKKGVKNFIEVEKKVSKEGKSIGWVYLDSGDILENSRYIRKELDKANLKHVKIGASSNLDEYKIAYLEEKNAPIDAYGSQTESINISDRPVLEAVYKLAQLVDNNSNITYAAKLTPGKLSLPGNKQVFRKIEKGKFKEDIIGFEKENFENPLLINYVKNGKLVKKLPSLFEIKKYFENQLSQLPEDLKKINEKAIYPVKISKDIEDILNILKEKHLN